MFQDLNPLDQSTATFEILIMLLVAFVVGFLIAWILRKGKGDISSSVADYANDELRLKLEDTVHELDQLRKELETKTLALHRCESEKAINTIDTPATSESDKENADKLGFKIAAAADRDDLTKVSGIGPFIEKKLNALGIYTFEQISEFSPETITKVTKAIEFFPGRIERDDWVGKARQLARK